MRSPFRCSEGKLRVENTKRLAVEGKRMELIAKMAGREVELLSRESEYRGTVSLPFEPGEHRRVAVKIVDDRGIESLRIEENENSK
jgi:adenine-specific DNA-methyltransferase